MGNALGAGRAAAARLAAWSAAACAPLVWVGVAAVLLVPASQRLILSLFTSGEDPVLLQKMRHLLYLVVVLELFDGVQTILSGVVSGAGKQARGFLVNALSYWVVALPVALLAGFLLNLGVEGMYGGMVGGPLTQCICYGVLIWRLRWEDEAAAAQRRVREACAAG